MPQSTEEYWNSASARLHADTTPATYTRFRDRVLKALGTPPKGARILDLGCGDGELTLRLADALPQLEWHACDFSERLIGLARQRTRDVDFQVRSMTDLSGYPDDFFDVTFSNGAFQYLSVGQLPPFFSELARITAPAGFSAQLEICDKAKFFEWFGSPRTGLRHTARLLLGSATRSYVTNRLWDDGTYWHRRHKVTRAAAPHWGEIQWLESEAAYRSNLVLRRPRGS